MGGGLSPISFIEKIKKAATEYLRRLPVYLKP